MYGYDELRVSAPYKVGTFKYMVGYNKNNEPVPCQVYIKECQLNVTQGHDEDISDVVKVEIKYKVCTNKGKCGWVEPKKIFNTKEELIKSLKK